MTVTRTDSMPEAKSHELCCNSKGGAHRSAICNRGCAHSTSDNAHEEGGLNYSLTIVLPQTSVSQNRTSEQRG